MPNVGRHCCLWCTITSGDLIKPLSVRKRSPERTLHTLQQDHQEFLQSGGDIRRAKYHNNVIGPSIFDIPLDRVTDNICISTAAFTRYHLGVPSWIAHFFGGV